MFLLTMDLAMDHNFGVTYLLQLRIRAPALEGEDGRVHVGEGVSAGRLCLAAAGQGQPHALPPQEHRVRAAAGTLFTAVVRFYGIDGSFYNRVDSMVLCKGGIFEAGFGEKVAFSQPSVDRFGKFLGGVMTLGQVKSVPNFC